MPYAHEFVCLLCVRLDVARLSFPMLLGGVLARCSNESEKPGGRSAKLTVFVRVDFLPGRGFWFCLDARGEHCIFDPKLEV